MSWRMWSVEGYGFDVADAEKDKIYEFIKAHEESLSKENYGFTLNESIKESISEIMEDENCDFDELTYNGTRALIISSAMTAETGIRFDAPGFTDYGHDPVMFVASMPWHLNEKEKELTEEKLKDIMDTYREELGLPEMVEWMEVTYSG